MYLLGLTNYTTDCGRQIGETGNWKPSQFQIRRSRDMVLFTYVLLDAWFIRSGERHVRTIMFCCGQ